MVVALGSIAIYGSSTKAALPFMVVAYIYIKQTTIEHLL